MREPVLLALAVPSLEGASKKETGAFTMSLLSLVDGSWEGGTSVHKASREGEVESSKCKEQSRKGAKCGEGPCFHVTHLVVP